jgi:hypothetical protein
MSKAHPTDPVPPAERRANAEWQALLDLVGAIPELETFEPIVLAAHGRFSFDPSATHASPPSSSR